MPSHGCERHRLYPNNRFLAKRPSLGRFSFVCDHARKGCARQVTSLRALVFMLEWVMAKRNRPKRNYAGGGGRLAGYISAYGHQKTGHLLTTSDLLARATEIFKPPQPFTTCDKAIAFIRAGDWTDLKAKPPSINKPSIRARKSRNQAGSSFNEFYQSWEWKRLRYDFLLVQGRRCMCCGNHADNTRIVVDHIKPIRHHWGLRLDRNNLQVLCDDCNMGKGSRHENDFRPLPSSDWILHLAA